MNVLTCQQVEEHLDLLAAGECDRPTRRAVEQHLDSCPTCAARYAASQRLQGLLDLHWNEAEQLRRLHERIDEAARQTRRPRLLVGPWMQRAAALAALLLVTFGLTLLMPKSDEPSAGSDLTMAVLTLPGARNTMEMKVVPAMVRDAVPPVPLDEKGITLKLPEVRNGDEYRRELLRRQDRGDLPLPPSLPVELTVQNNGPRPLNVQLGGPDAELRLDIQGPGVLRLSAPADVQPALLHQQTLRLAPGHQRRLAVDRLIAGSARHVEYVYLTEPGDYTLTIRLSALVDGKPSWLTSGPIPIRQ